MHNFIQILLVILFISQSIQYFEIILDRQKEPLDIDKTDVITQDPQLTCESSTIQHSSTKAALICYKNDLTFNIHTIVGLPFEKSNQPFKMSVDINQPWTWVKSNQCFECDSDNYDPDLFDKASKQIDLCPDVDNQNKCKGEKLHLTKDQIDQNSQVGAVGDHFRQIKGQFVKEQFNFLSYNPSKTQSWFNVLEEEIDSEKRLQNHEEIIQLKDFNILAVQQMVGYEFFESDGVIGLAPLDQSNNYGLQIKNTNFLQSLTTQQKDDVIDKQIFGIFINKKGANVKEHVITFGGINPNFAFQKRIDQLTWVDMPNKNEKYWNIDIKYLTINFTMFDFKPNWNIYVDNKIHLENTPAVFTLGSSFISLPWKHLNTLVYIFNAHSNTQCEIVDKGSYVVYCQRFSIDHELSLEFDFGISVGGSQSEIKRLRIMAQNLIGKCHQPSQNPSTQGRYDCIMNINLSRDDKIILGEPFMKQHYLIFDQQNQKVGFLMANDDQNWGIDGYAVQFDLNGLLIYFEYFFLFVVVSTLVFLICVVPLKYGIRNIKEYVYALKYNATRNEIKSLAQSHREEENPYAEVEQAMRERAMQEIQELEKQSRNENGNGKHDLSEDFSQNETFYDTNLDAFDLDFTNQKKNKDYNSLDQESGF